MSKAKKDDMLDVSHDLLDSADADMDWVEWSPGKATKGSIKKADRPRSDTEQDISHDLLEDADALTDARGDWWEWTPPKKKSKKKINGEMKKARRKPGPWTTGPRGGIRRRLPGGGFEYKSKAKKKTGRKRGRPSAKVGAISINAQGKKMERTKTGWQYVGMAEPKREGRTAKISRLVREAKVQETAEAKRRRQRRFFLETDTGYYSFTIDEYRRYLTAGAAKEGGVLEVDETDYGTKLSSKPKGEVTNFFDIGTQEETLHELNKLREDESHAFEVPAVGQRPVLSTKGRWVPHVTVRARHVAQIERLVKSYRSEMAHALGSKLNSIIFKADKPPGSGWQAIPGGRHGGFRRATGSTEGGGTKYEYWYPTPGHAAAAGSHHSKQARKAQKKLGRILRKKGVKQADIEKLLDTVETSSDVAEQIQRNAVKTMTSLVNRLKETKDDLSDKIYDEKDKDNPDHKKLKGLYEKRRKVKEEIAEREKTLKQAKGFDTPKVDAPVDHHDQHVADLKARARNVASQIEDAPDAKAKRQLALELYEHQKAYAEATEAREGARFNEDFPTEPVSDEAKLHADQLASIDAKLRKIKEQANKELKRLKAENKKLEAENQARVQEKFDTPAQKDKRRQRAIGKLEAIVEQTKKRKEDESEVKVDGKVTDAEKALLKEYNLQVVGKDRERAADIAKRVKEGIEKAADVCKMSPPVCKGNMGIPRSEMPQLLDESFEALRKKGQGWKADAAIAAGADPKMKGTMFDAFLQSLRDSGITVNDTEPHEKVPVGQLKATQREIKAGKAFGMADAHLKGEHKGEKVDLTDKPIVISKDNYILDGHHRFAAMTTIGADRDMNVIRVDATMDAMLNKSFDLKGVFRADMDDNVVAGGKPDRFKEKKKEATKKTRSTQLKRQGDFVHLSQGKFGSMMLKARGRKAPLGAHSVHGGVRVVKEPTASKPQGAWVPEKKQRKRAAPKKKKARKRKAGKPVHPWREKYGHLKLTKYPPAHYTEGMFEVNLTGDKDSHFILAWKDSTRNDKFPEGKTQYGYTPKFKMRNAAIKYERVKALFPMADEGRKLLAKRMNDTRLIESKRDAAACSLMISVTGSRVGSGGATRTEIYGTFGALTVQKQHVKAKGKSINIEFTGKDQVRNFYTFDHPGLVKWVKARLRDIKVGEPVFRTNYKQIRAAIDESALKGFKPKDFRTLVACETAVDELTRTPAPPPLPRDPAKAKRLLSGIMNDVSKRVAVKLNNEANTARGSYINPAIFAAWMDEIGASRWKKTLMTLAKGGDPHSVWDRALAMTLPGHDKTAELPDEHRMDEPQELEVYEMVLPVGEKVEASDMRYLVVDALLKAMP